ncbi:MAG: hypothetical protein HY900_16905 [Deltaproteobacteria bacterium]|nr:hypothetical protein [Deltaproteobacteria bacterium]
MLKGAHAGCFSSSVLRTLCAGLALGAVLLLVPACGRKGDPLPPGLLLPGAPTGLSLSAPAGQLTLSWEAPKEDLAGRAIKELSGYVVLRERLAPGQACLTCPLDFRPVATVDRDEQAAAGKPETSWPDPEVEPDWTYRYRVRALDRKRRPGPLSPVAAVTWVPLPRPAVEARPGDNQALLLVDEPRWPPSLTPLGVRVYSPDGRKLAEVPPGTREITVSGLPNRPVALSVRLAARSPEGWDLESRSAQVSVTPVDTVPPLPPLELASFLEEDGVRLVWIPAGTEPYSETIVLRTHEGGPYEEIARLPGGATSYVDRSVRHGVVYIYVVVGIDAAGNRSLPAREERIRFP